MGGVDPSWLPPEPPAPSQSLPPGTGGRARFGQGPALPLVPPRVRRVVGIAAAVVAVLAVLVWIVSFVPSSPIAAPAAALTFVLFVAIFPIWGVVVWDMVRRQQGMSQLRGNLTLDVEGWRRPAIVAVFALGFCSLVASMFLGGRVAGQPIEADGRYFLSNHGEREEISHEEYLRARSESSRFFISGVEVFAGIGALYLTRPNPDADVRRALVPEKEPSTPFGRFALRVGGVAAFGTEAPGGVDDVIARLRTVAPVEAVERPTRSVATVAADWDRPGRWPLPSFPLRLDGTITSTSLGGSSVRATVRPASKMARMMPFAAIWGLVVASLGALVLIGIARSEPMVGIPVLVVWVGFGFSTSYQQATVGRRTCRAAARELEAAAAGSPRRDATS